MKTGVKNILFFAFLGLLLLPAVQTLFRPFREKPLYGDFVLSERPVFNWNSWFTGSFQEPFEQYIKDHSGFRAWLIRLFNQVDFSFFRKANAEGVVQGIEGYLYEADYIRAYLGHDFVGEKFIGKKLRRAKFVQDYLKKELGIDLVIIFEPGKGSFYPEYFPEPFRGMKPETSNLSLYTRRAAELGLRFTDFNAWFLRLKGNTPYPLMPRYGTHWSVYGMTFAVDSLLHLIGETRMINIGKATVSRLEEDTRPRDTDDDVLRTMNLLWPKRSDILAYPVYHFDTAGQYDKPAVLVVADSYYWNIFNTRIPEYLFANQAFWYFNTKVYPDSYIEPKYVEDLDLKAEIEKMDVIFIMVTERFMYKFDWGFIDRIYELYTPAQLRDPEYDGVNRILHHSPWFNDVTAKAAAGQVSLEKVLWDESRYIFSKDDKASYLVKYGPEHFSSTILNDSTWLAHVRQKAAEQGRPEEEMLFLDADYMFRQNYKGLHEICHGIRQVMAEIRADRVRWQAVVEDAERWGISEDDYLFVIAEEKNREEMISRIRRSIVADPGWLAQVRDKAARKGISLDEMLRLDASYVYGQKRNPILD